MFVVGTQPATPVAPSGTTTFTITFTPASLGAKTATVSIANDDPDENPYTFSLTGTGVAPEINLRQGSTNLRRRHRQLFIRQHPGGQQQRCDQPSRWTTSALRTLNLTGTPRVAISGTDAAMFVVGTQPATPVAPSGTTTFTITFTPASLGAKTATVTIANDDSDENPYTFSLTGTGVAPEINVRQGSTNLLDGTGSYGFGNVVVGSASTAITFTVDNLGTSNLEPERHPAGGDQRHGRCHVRRGHPARNAGGTGGYHTFTITFTPGSLGAKTATVTIANDDSDENPYTFDLTGIGRRTRDQRPAGSHQPARRHRQLCIRQHPGRAAASAAITFTVDNLGTSNLALTGTPRVAISGTDAAMFVVGTQPATPVAPAGTSTFTITFTAASLGAKTATVTIANDDADENPYTFNLTGTGIAPEINVRQGVHEPARRYRQLFLRQHPGRQLQRRHHLHGGQPRHLGPCPDRHPAGGDQRDGRRDVRRRHAARYAGDAFGDVDLHDHLHTREPGREDGDRDDRQRRRRTRTPTPSA